MHKIGISDLRLIQYQLGMHICDYEGEKKKICDWFYDVICLIIFIFK